MIKIILVNLIKATKSFIQNVGQGYYKLFKK
jgi:hypothetical protein